MDIKVYMRELGAAARQAAAVVNRAGTQQKNDALYAIGEAIISRRDELMAENTRDIAAGREAGLDDAMLDRLTFTESRFDGMVDGLRQVASLDDPVGEISELA